MTTFYSLWYALSKMNLGALTQFPPVALYFVFLWSLVWKGFALWKSARDNQRNWFILMLVVNTAGLLEIAYLFFFAKKKMKLIDLKFWGK